MKTINRNILSEPWPSSFQPEVDRKFQQRWMENHPTFSMALREVYENDNRRSLGKFLLVVTCLLAAAIIGLGYWMPAFFGIHFLVIEVISIVGAVTLGNACALISLSRDKFGHEYTVKEYVETLVPVLWALVNYKSQKIHKDLPRKEVIEILQGQSMSDVIRSIDSMLVHMAFNVRTLELTCDEGNFELLSQRERFKSVHYKAVSLGVAEKNPQTYFDRAIPAVKAKKLEPK